MAVPFASLLFGILVVLALLIGLPVRYLISREWGMLRRALYFPIAGTPRDHHSAQRHRLLQRLRGTEVELTTDDDRTVHGVWVDPPRTSAGPRRSAVIMLHANAMVLDDMEEWANFYLALGTSVFLITFWGYPDPSEPAEGDGAQAGPPDITQSLLGAVQDAACCPTERGMYLDAEAALRHMQHAYGVTTDRALVHGISIGSAVAIALGVQHPGLKVTFDQGFGSLFEVSVHVGASLYEQLIVPRAAAATGRCSKISRLALTALQPALLRAAAWIVVRMLFKSGIGGPGVGAQDRMDCLGKARGLHGDLFVIHAEHDQMVPTSTAQRMLDARYGCNTEEARGRIICVPGGHCCFFGDAPELAATYSRYLVQCGFVASVPKIVVR